MRYRIDATIKTHVFIEASSPEEAARRFILLTAQELIEDGYDDVIQDVPVAQVEDE